MGQPARGFPPGHFLLELGGVSAGDLKNVQGGGAVADAIQEKVGADHIVKGRVSEVRFDDIVLTCGAGLSKTFYDWVDATSRMQAIRKDGAVDVFAGGKQLSRLEWQQGLITDIEFPALDAGSKDSFSLTIKITPEMTRHKAGSGQASRPAVKARPNWLACQFHLSIDGLVEACKHVSRVEPIGLVMKAVRNRVGQTRVDQIEPGAAVPGKLIITLPESKAQGFYDWQAKALAGPGQERSGRLESGPFTLQFGDLGIETMTQQSNLPGAMIRKIKVQMYCESIRFSSSSTA
jgi:hypothetical protein